MGWSDETLEQPFFRCSVCVGTMPQRENHSLVIPNHSGSHAEIEPIPFLLLLFLLSSCYKREHTLRKGE